MSKKKETSAADVLRGNDQVVCVLATGGTLHEVTPDFEWVAEVFVPPGRHRVSKFMPHVGRNNLLVAGVDVQCFTPLPRHVDQDFGHLAYETAASQTFRVDRAEREKRRNDALQRRLERHERRQALFERAMMRASGNFGGDDGEDGDDEADDAQVPAPAKPAEKQAAE